MKKMSFWAMAATVACLTLVGCKSKSDNNAAEGGADDNAATAAAEQAEAEEAAGEGQAVEGDLSELYSLCPFCLQVEGKTDAEGNPVTVDRQWVLGSSIGVSTIADWVVYTLDPHLSQNVDGWHFVGRDIVNADETYKIVDEDAWMSLSSWCTVRTEKYTKPKKVEPFTHLTFHHLYEVEGTEMEAPLLKTMGNRQQYQEDEAKEYAESTELTDRVQTSFELQEWVTVSLPAELASQDVTLAVMPFQHRYEGVAFDADKLSQALWSGKPEVDDETGYATASFYVSEEQPVGFYDLLLIKDEKAQYRLTLVMRKS